MRASFPHAYFSFLSQMPEFAMDKAAPLGQDFFDSLDRVDERALARLEIELRLNTLQELPDLRTMFFARRRQQQAMYPPQYRNYAMPQYHAAQRRQWPLHA